MIDAVWAVKGDLLMAVLGVAVATWGIRIELAERRRLARMARECKEREI